MGKNKTSFGSEEDIKFVDSSDYGDSDASVTASESELDESSDESNAEGNSSNDQSTEEEEEDEVLQAIRRENEKKRNHPPPITCQSYVTNISFHPFENLLAVANINGDCILYKYSHEENVVMSTLELHTKACRGIEFSNDGKILYSTAKDKSIMLSDVESGKLIKFYNNCHRVPPFCISVLDNNLFATGDEDGTIKLWDLRVKSIENSIFSLKKNSDYISDIIANESMQYLVCASGDGSLTSIDLQKRQFFVQSEKHEEELTCLGLFRSETKILCGTSKGKLAFYNWGEFGLYSDLFPTSKNSINCLIPITEDIVVTAYEDGHLRATHLFPHKPLGVVGQHELSVENLDISNNGKFIASTGQDNDIKFWNIEYFEEFEEVTKKYKNRNKRKEEFNLPSSKRTNVADFFSGLS